MTFASIPQGTALFLDANTLIYHFAADPKYGPACRQLVERIARQEIRGITSAHVLGDVMHRLMTIEAINQFGWQPKGIAQRLRKHQSEVKKLKQFKQAIDEVPQLGIQALPVDLALITAAAAVSQGYGLLTNDALVVAVMQAHGLTNLASRDRDFDGVPGVTRYAPG